MEPELREDLKHNLGTTGTYKNSHCPKEGRTRKCER